MRSGRHLGFGLCGGSGKDSDGKWLQWGRRAIGFCRRPNWGSWKAWLSIFCRCPSQLWEKLGQRAGIPGTCLFVFLHEKGGRDSSNLTSSVRRGQERTVRLDVVTGTVDIILIPQRPRTMRWRTERRISPYWRVRSYAIFTLPTGPTQRCCDGETVRERVTEDCRLTRRNPLHFLS